MNIQSSLQSNKILSHIEFAQHLKKKQSWIISNFITQVENDRDDHDMSARSQSRAFLNYHLDIVLKSIIGFIESNGEEKGHLHSASLSNKFDLQLPSMKSYSVLDLRKEYQILNDIIFSSLPSGNAISVQVQKLYFEIFQMSLSTATEAFILNSAIELQKHQEQSVKSEFDLRESNSQRDRAKQQRDDARKDHESMRNERNTLFNSQEWLQEVINRIPKPIFFLDIEEKKMWFSNHAARKLLGLNYENEWVYEKKLPSLKAYDLEGRELEVHELPSRRALNGEKINGEELFLETPVCRFWIKVFVEQIPNFYGHPKSAIVLLQDITTLRSTEQDLRRAQSDLNEAIDIAQIGFWSLDLKNSKINVTPILLKQFGLSSKQFNGDLNDALNRIHEDDRDFVNKAIFHAIATNGPYHIEYRVRIKDNEIRWIEAKGSVIYDDRKKPFRFAGTTVDITDRKLTQEKIMNERFFLDQIFQNSPAAMATWIGDDLVFDRVNPEYQKIFTGRDLIGKPFMEVCPELRGQGFDDLLREVLHTGKPYVGKEMKALIAKEPGGVIEERFFNFSYIQMRDSSGKPFAVYDHAVDVTDAVMARQDLEVAQRSAEVANQTKSQFLANMSHEIRTPLGAIMGFTSLLKDSALDREQLFDFVSVIERNSQQLLRIIDDILDLSKVEAGMLAIERIDFSLSEFLSDFSSLMGLKAREKGITFSSKAMNFLPTMINTDPTRLRQILMNIVGNAIKFTDHGHVELRCGFNHGFLEFEVEDTGRGISEEHRTKIFQPFAQADSSITRKYGGTGLGLVLTRSLAEALDGEFELVASEIDKGSLFRVRVAIQIPANSNFVNQMRFESNAPEQIETKGELEGMKVLLVEDSLDNQALFSIYLNRAGVHPDLASNGLQGVECALMSAYDVILMDVQMPVMDGITAVKNLRSKGYIGPIVALTAHAMKEERDRCLQAGFNDFLSKPASRDDIVDMVLKFKSPEI